MQTLPCRGEIPTLSALAFRMSGCQLSSVAVPCEPLDSPGLLVPADEPGLCSRAISWQVVPGVPCPVQMCLSLCASLVCHCVQPGDQCHSQELQVASSGFRGSLAQVQGHCPEDTAPAEAAPAWGLHLHRACTARGSQGVPGVGTTKTVGRGQQIPIQKTVVTPVFLLTRRQYPALCPDC